jgi:hypothetical protein
MKTWDCDPARLCWIYREIARIAILLNNTASWSGGRAAVTGFIEVASPGLKQRG